MNILAYNPDTSYLEKSFLSKSYASGVSTLLVKNANNFLPNTRILIGEMGRERSEIVTVQSATNTTIALTASTIFPHDADDPVYILEFDKVRIYRSTNGQNGTYTRIGEIDLDVDNSQNATIYDDVNALTTYWYQLSYYSSVDNDESERTDPIAASGYNTKSLGAIIPEVAEQVGDPDFIEVPLNRWLAWANDINDDMILQAKRPFRFLKRTVKLDLLPGAISVPLPVDLWKINKLSVDDTWAVSPVYMTDIDTINYQNKMYPLPADYINMVAVDDVGLMLHFAPAARTDRIGAFTLQYYKHFTRFDNLSSIVETPTPLVYKLGLKREYYLWRADQDSKYLAKASEFDKKYNAELTKMQREKNIMADGPTGMAPERKGYSGRGVRRYRQ